MSQKSRSLTIDATKGMAILLVMTGHVLVWNHMEDGIIYDVIKVIQMPLFILVSGYLCGMGRKISSLSAYDAKLKKRALSYLTPFFFWIVLQHPLHPVANIVETLFGLDKGLWFLMTLFLLTLMVYTAELAGAVAERSFGALGGKIVFWAVYLGLAAAVLLETLVGVEFLSPGLTRLYLPFYLAGYLAGEQKERLKALPEMVKNAGGALALIAGSSGCDHASFTGAADHCFLSGLCGGLLASVEMRSESVQKVSGLAGRLYPGDLCGAFPFRHGVEPGTGVCAVFGGMVPVRAGVLYRHECHHGGDYRSYEAGTAA